MKETVIESAQPSLFGDPLNGEQSRSDDLHRHSKSKHPAQEASHVTLPLLVQCLTQRSAMAQCQPVSGQINDEHAECHQAETAELHQKQQDPLAEQREMCAGIEDSQSGDRGSRHRSK